MKWNFSLDIAEVETTSFELGLTSKEFSMNFECRKVPRRFKRK
jgi:hypothetical protein